MTPRTSLILLLLACILLSTGCTQPFALENSTADSTAASSPQSVAKYQLTIAQPEDSARLVTMDTDVYNLGEVVEFVITNEKTSDLSCSNTPPAFVVRYQTGSGQWVTRMGGENTALGNTTRLKPGESTHPYRFVTTGWAPGRYRIVSDCGVSHEILLRALPSLTPAETPCLPAGNTTPFIHINAVSDHYATEAFTISGTTSLAPGQELRYSIFAVSAGTTNITAAKMVSSSTLVSEGSCGTNTWYVEGVIEVPGDYFIGISDNGNTVSAVRRFTVLDAARPTETATLMEQTKAPGITTG